MTAVRVEFAGDDAKLQAVHERLLRDQQKLLDRYAKLGDTSKKASDEAIKAEKQHQESLAKSEKLIKSVATAEEVHAAALAQATELAQKKYLTDEQLARVTAKLNQELRDATGETKKLQEAEKTETAAKEKAEATTRKYMTSVEKLKVDLAEVKKQFDAGRVSAETLARAEKAVADEQSRISSEQAKLSSGSTFDGAVDGLKKYTTAAGAAAVAVGAIRALWDQIKRDQEAGLAALNKTAETDRNLLQVSTSLEDYNANAKLADTLSIQTGVDRNVSRQVMFQGISEGFKEVVPEIIASNQVLDPVAAAGAAGQIPALFKGAIDPMSAVSMALRQAESSRLDFSPFARSLPQAAEGGSIAGASPEETMAVLGVTASRFKSGDVAADRFKAFATAVAIDKGSTDPEYEKKLQTEKERAANAAKELRRKEERVADIQKQLNDTRVRRSAVQKEALQTQLERAKRDVAEFDRNELKVVEPRRSKPERASLAGLSPMQAVAKLATMTEEQRRDFLGESQELNVEYKVLKDEADLIEKERQANIRDREARKQGGGRLKEKVAIANSAQDMIARKEVARSRTALEFAEAKIMGEEGATAETASNKMQISALSKGLGSRTINRFVSGPVSSIAANAGMSAESSALLGSAAGNFPAGSPMAAIVGLLDAMTKRQSTEEVNQVLSNLESATKDLKEAAKETRNAAAQGRDAASKNQQGAARAQAARAGQ